MPVATRMRRVCRARPTCRRSIETTPAIHPALLVLAPLPSSLPSPLSLSSLSPIPLSLSLHLSLPLPLPLPFPYPVSDPHLSYSHFLEPPVNFVPKCETLKSYFHIRNLIFSRNMCIIKNKCQKNRKTHEPKVKFLTFASSLLSSPFSPILSRAISAKEAAALLNVFYIFIRTIFETRESCLERVYDGRSISCWFRNRLAPVIHSRKAIGKESGR